MGTCDVSLAPAGRAALEAYADPGVLEINLPVCHSWHDYASWMELLEQARREIQRSINPKLKMKYTPRLEFLRDESAIYVQKIHRLFREIEEK